MYPEALTDPARQLFPSLEEFEGFYLVGGTTLALQIEYRDWVDFDFFCPDEFPRAPLPKVKRVLKNASCVVSVDNPGELTAHGAEPDERGVGGAITRARADLESKSG